jgi:uncharacterized membrane protein YdjX (TVP38/TMEM64 family)
VRRAPPPQILGALAAFAKQYATKEQMDQLMELAEGETGPRGMALVVGICFFGAIIGMPVVPVEVFTGYKYGMVQGFLLVVLGKQTGGMIAYWIGRTILRDFVRKNIVPKWKILQALDGAFEEEGLKMALAFRSMYIPTGVKNYGCAALGCGFWQATAASMVFGPLYAVTNLYAGATARDLRNAGKTAGTGETDYVKQAVKIAMGGFFVLGIGMSMKIMKKQLAKVTAEVEKKAKAKKSPPVSGKSPAKKSPPVSGRKSPPVSGKAAKKKD